MNFKKNNSNNLQIITFNLNFNFIKKNFFFFKFLKRKYFTFVVKYNDNFIFNWVKKDNLKLYTFYKNNLFIIYFFYNKIKKYFKFLMDLKYFFFNFYLNLFFKYRYSFRLHGVGFKALLLKISKNLNNSYYFIVFELGFSHKCYFLIPKNFYFSFMPEKMKLKRNKVFSFTFYNKIYCNFLLKYLYTYFRKPDIYKGKGLRIVNHIYKLKKGKRASW